MVVDWTIDDDLKCYLKLELAPGQFLGTQKHFIRTSDVYNLAGSQPKGTYYSLHLVFGRSIQCGRHNAAEDAQATMALYVWDRANIIMHSCKSKVAVAVELSEYNYLEVTNFYRYICLRFQCFMHFTGSSVKHFQSVLAKYTHNYMSKS